jgi:hypothetical protein
LLSATYKPFMLSAVMLNVVVLSVFILSVVAPFNMARVLVPSTYYNLLLG